MRNRTPKTLGTRHDPSYVYRPSRFTYWRGRLAWGGLIAAVAFLVLLAASPLRNKQVIYSKGPVSSAHAFIAGKCELCHWERNKDRKPVGFFHKASDDACLACHEAPVHHSQGKQPPPPSCASCHAEHQGHQGLVHLSHVQDRACVNCHQDLDHQTNNASVQPKEARYIHKFNSDHPEFAAAQERMMLLDKSIDKKNKKLPGIVFHHAKHIGPTLMVKKGVKLEYVTLQCSNCHRPVAAENYTPWSYPKPGLSLTTISPDSSQRPHPDAGRETMSMPTYEKNCAGCHEIPFDGHFSDSAPHLQSNSEPELRRLHTFVKGKLQGYIDSYPNAIHMPDPPLPGLPEMQPLASASSSKEWVDQRVSRAEKYVLAGLKCRYCHQMDAPKAGPEELSLVPVVKPSGFKPRQMPFSVFSHEAHTVLTCGSCHGDLPAAQGCCQDKTPAIDPDIPDVKLPGIKVCQSCHNGNPSDAGKAENGCFLCHQYHKWNERTGPPTKYTFQQLGLPAASGQGGKSSPPN